MIFLGCRLQQYELTCMYVGTYAHACMHAHTQLYFGHWCFIIQIFSPLFGLIAVMFLFALLHDAFRQHFVQSFSAVIWSIFCLHMHQN